MKKLLLITLLFSYSKTENCTTGSETMDFPWLCKTLNKCIHDKSEKIICKDPIRFQNQTFNLTNYQVNPRPKRIFFQIDHEFKSNESVEFQLLHDNNGKFVMWLGLKIIIKSNKKHITLYLPFSKTIEIIDFHDYPDFNDLSFITANVTLNPNTTVFDLKNGNLSIFNGLIYHKDRTQKDSYFKIQYQANTQLSYNLIDNSIPKDLNYIPFDFSNQPKNKSVSIKINDSQYQLCSNDIDSELYIMYQFKLMDQNNSVTISYRIQEDIKLMIRSKINNKKRTEILLKFKDKDNHVKYKINSNEMQYNFIYYTMSVKLRYFNQELQLQLGLNGDNVSTPTKIDVKKFFPIIVYKYFPIRSELNCLTILKILTNNSLINTVRYGNNSIYKMLNPILMMILAIITVIVITFIIIKMVFKKFGKRNSETVIRTHRNEYYYEDDSNNRIHSNYYYGKDEDKNCELTERQTFNYYYGKDEGVENNYDYDYNNYDNNN